MATAVASTNLNGVNGIHVAKNDNSFAQLSSILSNSPELFLQPTLEIQQAAIQAAKSILDPLAKDVADVQLARRNENRRKRKRGDDEEEEPILQLRQVYTKGFGVKQIWEQARRVLDSAYSEVSRELELHVTSSSTDGDVLAEDIEEDDMSLDGDEADIDIDGMDGDSDLDLGDEEMEDDMNGGLEDEDEDEEGLEEVDNIEEGSDLDASSSEDTPSTKEVFVQDKHGLNDGFFSIDDFNKQSQFLEQMDARGDDDNPSDEDDIDWDADPLSMPSTKSKLGKQDEDDDEEEEDEDEEDGPTFGDAKLEFSDDNGSMDEDEEGLGDSMGMSNANDVRYADFFEPPAKKPSKTKRMRALPKTQPAKESRSGQNDEDAIKNDIERAMADVRRDLLDSDAEEEDLSEEEDESSDDLKPRKTKQSNKNLSTHEKQRAAIAAEIRQLEAANVAKRDWQLSGEARAADRPLNSLIEEDLEFERAGKPVPVVTAETSEEIEQLIKRRILAREFDEVIRRQPGAINSATETRRGRVEVDDTKPQAGLGEIYEQEHLKTTDPTNYVDKRSTATKKQHEQIDILWREVNDQLNALSNLHFKPKRLDLELKTVEDKPRIAMEDARPVGDLEAGEGGMLAPQEVYRPGVDGKPASKSEIQLGKGNTGITMNREELTREEKLRRRRREKERNKKAGENQAQIVLGRKKNDAENRGKDGNGNGNGNGKKQGKKVKEQDKADIISDLKKGNVKIIGKGGELQSIEKGKGRGKGRNDVELGQVRGDAVGSGRDAFVGSNLKL